jgi:hypothetical protein
MTTLYLRIVFFSVLFLTSHHLANACEFGPAENRAGVSHPRSADVTSALRDAKTAGILETNSVSPKNGEVLDTRSIVGRMQRFGNALASSGAEAASSLSILLVEDGLWSRYRAMPEGVAFQMQTRGAQADDTVIITGEAVLAAMEDGILSSNEAILRGLIVIVPGDSIDDRKVLSALASFAKADNPDQIALKRSRSVPSWPD